jgi:outer membrane protein TolC
MNKQQSMKHVLSILFLTGFIQVQAQQTLDLETCLKMADSANLTINNAGLDKSINAAQRGVYLAARYPQLNFVADYKYNAIIPGQVVPGEFFGAPPGTFSTVQFGVPYTLGNTLQLTQILYNPQVNYGLTALKINNEVVSIQERLVTQEVKQQVASTFFNLQAITKQLEFVQLNISNMDKLISNMNAMVKEGLTIQTESDKLMINKLSLQNTEASLKATASQLEEYLKILIGMDLSQSIKLKVDGLVEQTILVDQSTVAFPEIALLETQQRLNKEERKGTNMSYLPNLSFYASYNYNFNMKPADDYRVGIEGAFLGLRLDWTLFDGLEKYNKQKVNRYNSEKLANQRLLTEQQLTMKMKNAQQTITVQTSALEVTKEQLKLAQRVYTMTEAKFKEGLVGSNDLILAENGLQEAQTGVVAAYIKLRQAELDYLKTIGQIH